MKLATKAEKAEAEKAARDANCRLNEIRDAERLSENKGLLGKAFKYKNNYSCPEKPSDYWWHYTKVVKVDEAGILSLFKFQIDKNGQVNVETQDHAFNRLGGSIPIPVSEFNKAWRGLQKKIANTKP